MDLRARLDEDEDFWDNFSYMIRSMTAVNGLIRNAKLVDIKSLDDDWIPKVGDYVRRKGEVCEVVKINHITEEPTYTVRTPKGGTPDTPISHLTRADDTDVAVLKAQNDQKDDDDEMDNVEHTEQIDSLETKGGRRARDAEAALLADADDPTQRAVKYSGKRDNKYLGHRRSIFNLNIPGPLPRCIEILNMAERMMIARASVCLTVHNRVTDTGRPMPSSKGLATILPMDYNCPRTRPTSFNIRSCVTTCVDTCTPVR